MLMLAPNVELAKDSLWVYHAENVDTIYDNFEDRNTAYEVVDATEVTDMGEVPEDWRDALPWYHPQHEPSADVEVGKLLAPSLADTGKWAVDMLATLEKQKEEIEKKMENLQKFTSPNAESIHPESKP
jgi:hypothetical protein